MLTKCIQIVKLSTRKIPQEHNVPRERTLKTTPKRQEQLLDQELLVIREIAKLMGKSLDEALVIREMLHLLSELLGLNRGRVVLRDAESGACAIRYAYGLTQQEMRRGRYAAGEGITGKVIQTGETIIVQDVDADPNYLARAVDRKNLPGETVSFIALPIEQGGQIIGVLGVHRLRKRARALADDLQILKIVATFIGQIIRLNQLVQERTLRLETENRELKYALERKGANYGAYGIVGESLLLRQALRQIEQVSSTDATVLLLGESGTGKELFARALHLASARRDQPFIKVNCGAIPENLFESELFGHEKGAFTGATAGRPGYFEQANNGTLFLDEIGDMPLPMQVKLLRVLQENTIQRVGSRKETPVNVRIVAATNQDLQNLVSMGKFRLDLFYRLNVIPVKLPALRERHDDIRMLVRYHLTQINQAYQRNVSLTAEAQELLVRYDWPGNVRQLRNVLERIVLLAEGPLIGAREADSVLTGEGGATQQAPVTVLSNSPVRAYQAVQTDDTERIQSALAQCHGNKSRAAQRLGMTLRQLNYRIKILAIA
jgi:Nif-specific regulatory protein